MSKMERSSLYRLNLLLPLLLFLPQLVTAASVEEVLNQVYDSYDRKNKCWRTRADEPKYHYCLKIDRSDKLETETGKRTYVLLSGERVDEEGEWAGAHASSGMIGALVIGEGVGGKPEIIAGDPRISMGAWGQGSEKWELVKLGPKDYWGWKNNSGYGGQGRFITSINILAPYGKRIKELAGFTDSFSDEGSKLDETEPSTVLESTFEIDSTQINAKVFPLIMRVSGKIDGKPLKKTTWEFPFDTKSWSYIMPKGWPLKDRGL